MGVLALRPNTENAHIVISAFCPLLADSGL